MAVILALIAACTKRKSKCLLIFTIVIGAVCIVLAIVFWILLGVMLSRKADLESKYCPVLTTACCSGTEEHTSAQPTDTTCLVAFQADVGPIR